MDVHTREQRSRNMSAIRGKDTKPEIIVRRIVHRLGYRFRLHRRDLPGCPDLVFPGRCKIIFVHGCFWHQHTGCRHCHRPRTRAEFWAAKLDGNVSRDKRVQRDIRSLGWKVLVLWECQTSSVARLTRRIDAFLRAK